MKKIVNIMAAIAVFFGVLQAEDGFEPLFNGKDLHGWQSIRENAAEGTGAFSVNEAEKALQVYVDAEAGSVQETDCLYTEKDYSHFVLKMEYKWMEDRFAPRVEHDRDAGLLFHIHGGFTKVWPKCLEMQLGESDAKKTKQRYTTGDLWVIGKDLQAMNSRDGNMFYSPGVTPVAVGKGVSYDKSYVPQGNEKPHSEWNEIVLTVRGGEEAIFELNGKIVNRISNMTHEVNGERVSLHKGRIGLQAEYAELMYRNIRIKELPPKPIQ